MQHVGTLVKQGLIREMKPHEKGYFSLILFIKQKMKENPNSERLWT